MQPSVLAVDLASKKYKDIGFALLPVGAVEVIFLKAEELGLSGKPFASDLAPALNQFCLDHDVKVLILDGPQGWKSPHTGIEHMRIGERVLNTPAKTGVIGHVKPGSALRYVAFSINLFHSLRVDFGWSLLTRNWHTAKRKRWLVEGFPTSAWKTLGLSSLPAKSRTKRKELNQWADDFKIVSGLHLGSDLTHDDLQAAVLLPAAIAIQSKNVNGVVLSGMDPRYTWSGDVLEGWIANPRVSAAK